MTTYPLFLRPYEVILVETKIVGPKGDRIIRAILDTGATYTMIDNEILIDVGYNPASHESVHPITTASGLEYCRFIKIKSIVSLGHTMKGIEICVHSLPPSLPAKGLLGLNFLRHFNLHLRFLDRILELSR